MNTQLNQNTILTGTPYSYSIESVLGQGTFGITYLASVKMQGPLGCINANAHVAIKEFFMKEINGREGSSVTSGSQGRLFVDYRNKFVQEAAKLSKLQHPNIIKVLDSFEANNTVYYVMEYLDGGSLDDLIKRKQTLSEEETVKFARQIGQALSYMHRHNVLHLDLKPGNVMLNHEGNAVLIDFGLSKQYQPNGEPESSTSVGAGTPGYAPLEQAGYDGKGILPVTMDVYALGATMYKMLTGQRPPDASMVLNEGLPTSKLTAAGISQDTIDVITKAMSPTIKRRFQSVEELMAVLPGGSAKLPEEPKVNIDPRPSVVDEVTVVAGPPSANSTHNVRPPRPPKVQPPKPSTRTNAFDYSISTCLKKYSSFNGRASRSEYWWFYLVYFVCSCIPYIGFIVSLAGMLPVLAAGVRRLHDTNNSGWWLLCPIYNIVLLASPGSNGPNRYND